MKNNPNDKRGTLHHLRKECGVSEILGTVLLLAISVALFSVLYLLMQNVLVADQSPTADLVGHLDENTVYIEHHGGNSLPDSITITVSIGGTNYDIDFDDSFDENNNGYWDIGERVYLEDEQIGQSFNIDVSVVDQESNKAIYLGTLQEGAMTGEQEVDEPEENDSTLSSWWRLDENNGTTAYDSIGSNHATVDSASWIAGINQSGLLYDDSRDALIASSSESLTIIGDLSISLWVYFNDLPSGSDDMIFTYTTGGESESHNTLYELSIDSSGNLSYKHEYDGGSDETISFDEPLVADNWYHLVLIRDTSEKQLSLYLNNTFIETVDYSYNPTGGSFSDLYLGSDRPSSNQAIEGILDEIKLFNGLLSTDEIEELYAEFSENMKDIISHWPFNENMGITAFDVEGDNDGVVHGATWNMGITDSALSFDGFNDYVEVEDDYSLDPIQITLMAWIKHDSVSDHVAIIDKRDNTDDGYDLYISPSGKAWFRINDETVDGVSDIDDNNWHHVVGTYDGSRITVFVDGVEENSKVIGSEIIDTTNPLRIGLERSNDFDFSGLIDEVKIYNFALSASEINQSYKNKLDSGVVSIWHFDENAGSIAFDSADGNDGVINGTNWVTGVKNSSLSFDGENDYVYVPDSENLDFESNFSAMAWVKWTIDPETGESWANVLNKGEDDYNTEWQIQHSEDNSNFEFAVRTDVARRWTYSTTEIKKDIWYHVAGVYDGSEIKIYVNGTCENQRDLTGNIQLTDEPVNIGRRSSEHTRYFTGLIDEMYLYNKALSAEELQNYYNETKPQSSSIDTLVAYWNFNEDDGLIAFDSSGNNNNGTINDASWTTGINESALSFDGDESYVTVSDDDSLDLTNSGTIEAWIYIENHQPFAGIVHKGEESDFSDEAYSLQFWDTGADLYFGLFNDDGDDDHIECTDELEEERWYHVAATWNESIFALYINGELDNSKENTIGPVRTTDGDVQIGSQLTERYNEEYGYFEFEGKIDEVKLYTTALTPNEINQSFLSNHEEQSSPEGMIAQWSLDENSGSTASDTIGSNDGSITGATWSSGISGSALQFDGDNDFVQVPHDDTFNLTSALTLEAWINPLGDGTSLGEITKSTIDSFTFGSDGSEWAKIIEISDTIYAIVYEDWDADGWVKTVEISNAGVVLEDEVDTLEFDDSYGREPDIFHITDEVYAIAYRGASNDGYVATIRISSDGSISNDVIDVLEFDTSKANYPEIIQISNTIFAIVYQGNGDEGFISTIEIGSDGSIDDTVIDTLEFDSSTGREPDILHVTDEVYAIAYRGPGNDGYLVTIEISSDGSIANDVIDSFEFEDDDCYNPELINVGQNVYAITYDQDWWKGYVKTIEIDDSGNIDSSVIDSFEYEGSTAVYSHIFYLSQEVYAISHMSSGSDGFVKTLRIGADGTIGDDLIDTYEFDTQQAYYPFIIRLSEDAFALVFTNGDWEGELKTIEMNGNRGIIKNEAFGIDFTSSTVSGFINKQLISGSLSDGWNHVVLTFDKDAASDQLKLYVNGSLQESEASKEQIQENGNDLFFGLDVQGFIDEIILYDEALTQEQVNTRFNVSKP